MNLTTRVQTLYSKIYKILLKEIVEALNNWKGILFSWIKKLNMVKIAMLSKPMYRFNAVTIRVPANFFVSIDKPILKFIWICKGPRRVKMSQEKNKLIELTISDFKTYYKAQGNIYRPMK